MLLRVAESVINSGPAAACRTAVGKTDAGWVQATASFDRRDERYDFSDPRVIVLKSDPARVWLTSMSHLRLARSRDGVNFPD